MKYPLLKRISSISLLSLLAACSTIPASGPSKKSITTLSSQSADNTHIPDVNIVDVNNQVVQSLFTSQQKQSFTEFNNATRQYNDVVNVGDVLDITVWEAAPAVLFGNVLPESGSGSSNLTKLPEQMVGSNGKISVPFLNPISVQGKTPEQIQNDLMRRWKPMANQPQVVVRITKNNSANVTVVRQGNSVRMPLTAHGERVLDAIAAVGGSSSNEGIQDINVQLTRNMQMKSISFERLIADPSQNINLQAGDVVSLIFNPYSFTALGAVGNNRQIKFSTKGINLAEAIGEMGGLVDSRSDPSGVFVFRYQPFNELSYNDKVLWQQRGYSNGMDVPTVYRVDLRNPQSFLWLQRFPMHNKDVVYVANSSSTEFQKFLRIIYSLTSPIIGTIGSINNLTN